MTISTKVFAALGPGDIVAARKAAIAGAVIGGTSIAYSEQFLSYCRHREFEVLAISYNSRVDELQNGTIRVENRPKPIPEASGLWFYICGMWYALYLARRAWRFGAVVAILDLGTAPPFTFCFFRMLGIKVLVDMHNALWPRGHAPRGPVARTVRWLNARFFRHGALAAVGVSPECERQFAGEARGNAAFFQYRCQFERDGFKLGVPYDGGPFRVLFVGRAESNKGILDIPEIARQLQLRCETPIVFEVCGDGPALRELKRMVKYDDAINILIHGHVERRHLLDIYARAHAVIIPTRSTFTEGVPAVCAEAMLSGLPVITSEVAHAADVIGAATIEVATDEIEGYVRAILSLIQDPKLYHQLRSQCHALSLQFLDRSFSLPAAVDRILSTTFATAKMQDCDKLFN
ncbi:glycosyltransferase family 4 protein [Bradyrhizobium sp. CB3481]|uniref:glycosyltransferase family 4 protein n=1 Tax=Bradyrhizobium sp. CB3481 TaxID=3039158 RepID=UPI0024B20F79|nr:glycosyltransferase family 4 protein [Bradyrhizobium sp. CB3481]WFU18788.1 glycosyltransferase family 4 protein [Bradyrhizobium sp. CB3481]